MVVPLVPIDVNDRFSKSILLIRCPSQRQKGSGAAALG